MNQFLPSHNKSSWELNFSLQNALSPIFNASEVAASLVKLAIPKATKRWHQEFCVPHVHPDLWNNLGRCYSSLPHQFLISFSNVAWKHLFFPCLYLLIFQFLSSTAINNTMPVKCNSETQLYLFCKVALPYHQSEMRFCNLLLILEQVILWEKPHGP